MTRSRSAVALLLLLLLGCSHEENIEWQEGRRTVLVYLAGDNSLSAEVVAKRAALVQAWCPERKGTLLIFTDHKGGVPVLERVSALNGVLFSDTLRVYANDNSASAELLGEVIADMQSLAPARSYGLWLFSHGTGWLPAGFFENPYGMAVFTTPQVCLEAYRRPAVSTRSFARDGNSEMEIADLKAALPDGLFDFIVFESCFMGNVETIYALRNKAPWMLVSPTEIISPGFAPIYDKVLPELYEAKADLQAVAELFYRYFDAQEGAYRGAAITLVNTAGMASLVNVCRPVLQRMARESTIASAGRPCAPDRFLSSKPLFSLGPTLSQESLLLSDSLLSQDSLLLADSLFPIDQLFPLDPLLFSGPLLPLDRLDKHLFFDFRHYFSLIADPSEMDAIDAALNQVVACYYHTPKMISVSLENTSGLSVYAEQPDLKTLNSLYRQTEWWTDLIGR